MCSLILDHPFEDLGVHERPIEERGVVGCHGGLGLGDRWEREVQGTLLAPSAVGSRPNSFRH